MKKLLFFIASFFLIINLFAQSIIEPSYHHHTEGTINQPLSTGFSGTGSNINVIYQKLQLSANPDDASKTLTGSSTIVFKTIVGNVQTITLDFNNNSFNNSNLQVQYHNAPVAFFWGTVINNDILEISLPNALALDVIDSITISYKGVPPPQNGNAEGYQRKTDASNNNYIYTLSESYEDKDWWPCKADMQDRIDSLDIIVTVPNTFWVAANGVMTDSSIIGANRTFVFKHRYPIPTYLVAIGIAKYKRFYLGNLLSGSNNVPFVVNIFSGKTTTQENNIMIRMNNNKLVFQEFCKLFGNYPFDKEKHGYYEFGFSGGMEHQTFSGMGTNSLTSNTILAHELGHQWFGNKVTFSTWNDLWLAEGFANYSEALAFEFVPSIGINYITKMGSLKATAQNNNSTPINISDISNSNTIWTSNNVTAIYERGAMVVSQLRCLLGDSNFFRACRSYLNDTLLAYKSATTTDVKRHFERFFGDSLNNYFNEWIYKKGTPSYNVQWANSNNKIVFKLSQQVNSSGSNGAASSFFPMPVVLKISNGSVDTTVIIYHKNQNQTAYINNGFVTNSSSNSISFSLNFIPTTVEFDPENKTMASGTLTYNAILPIQSIHLNYNKVNHSLICVVNAISENVLKVELEKSENGIDFLDFGMMNTNDNKNFEIELYDIKPTYIFFRAKVTTQNGIYFSNITKVELKKFFDLEVYPNPVKQLLNVSFSNPLNKKHYVCILNIYGKKVIETDTKHNFIQFKNLNLANGTYFVEIKNEFNEILQVKKIKSVK